MSLIKNVNTKNYWDDRFQSGDWASRGGRSQTENFARAQAKRLGIKSDFDGSICDFGCATGEAFAVYRRFFPKAKLIGVDFSSSAINIATSRYPFASFICGSTEDVPTCDVIITSNVLEHIDNDRKVANELSFKCKKLFVIVPYKEDPLDPEHIRSYDEFYFSELSIIRFEIYFCRGWTEIGRGLIKKGFHNIRSFLFGGKLQAINRQILFEFNGRNSK
jgi:hypothetical protein